MRHTSFRSWLEMFRDYEGPTAGPLPFRDAPSLPQAEPAPAPKVTATPVADAEAQKKTAAEEAAAKKEDKARTAYRQAMVAALNAVGHALSQPVGSEAQQYWDKARRDITRMIERRLKITSTI